MATKITHRLVTSPTINARFLSEYMEASERSRRTILKNCKYPAVARILQHDRAKSFIVNFIAGELPTNDKLKDESDRIRAMMADSDFDRDVLDSNADYLLAFSSSFSPEKLPVAEIRANHERQSLTLSSVQVRIDALWDVKRQTKNNKTKTGLGALRFAKGKPLNPEVANWNAALLLAARKIKDDQTPYEPDPNLCFVIDAMSGSVFSAPGDAVTRFKNMEAACATIADAWDKIEPPANAVLQQ